VGVIRAILILIAPGLVEGGVYFHFERPPGGGAEYFIPSAMMFFFRVVIDSRAATAAMPGSNDAAFGAQQPGRVMRAADIIRQGVQTTASTGTGYRPSP
jgi:hypothetical protein